jgi:hypothetical protein
VWESANRNGTAWDGEGTKCKAGYLEEIGFCDLRCPGGGGVKVLEQNATGEGWAYGPIRCAETSVKYYHSTLRNIAEERRSQMTNSYTVLYGNFHLNVTVGLTL